MVVVLIIGIYTSRVLLHTLGVEDYGIYNVVCGFVAMFAFLNTSMNNGIQRFYNYELGKHGEEGARKVYHCSVATQISISIMIVLLTETIGLWYIDNKLVVPPDRLYAAECVFHSAVVSLVFLIIQIPYSAAIMAHERMDYYAICSVIDVLLKLLIVLALPFIDKDNLIVYGILMIGISVLDFFLYYVYAKYNFSELKGKFHLNRNLFKEMIVFSGWNLFGSFSGVMKEQGLNVLLNLFFGPVVNAARGLAYQVSGGVQSFIINVTTAARPQLTQSYAQGNYSRTINIMFSMSKMSYICLFILALPVIMESHYLLKIWLGNEIPAHTNSFVILVVLYSLFHVFNPPTSFVVHATGKMRAYQLYSSVVSLMLLPASYLALELGCTPEFIFVLNIIFMVLIQITSILILKQLISFSLLDYLSKVILVCAIMSLLSSIAPYIIYMVFDEGFVRLLLMTAVSSISVLFFSFFIVLNNTEKQIVYSYLDRLKKGCNNK